MKIFNSDSQNYLQRTENFFSDGKNVFAVFLVMGLVTFWPALFGDFVGDDVLRVIEYEPLLSGSLWDLLFYYSTDRPIVMFTVWLNYKMAGLNPFIYKLTNLIFHFLCAYSGYLLLKRILKSEIFKNTISFLAAGIFLVHPLNHHVVQAAVQRSVAMAGIFLILSFLCFINFYEKRTKTDFLFSVFLFLLAVLSKPVSIALPAVLVVYLLMEKAKVSDIVRWISVYFVFWLIPLWTYSSATASTETATVFKFGHWQYFLIQTKVFFIYLHKFFFPFPMEFIHAIHNSIEKIYAENFIPYLAIYSLIIISLTVWFLRKRSLISGLLLMGYVLYMPQSSFYSILHVLFYHRVYLTLLFGAAALCILLINGRVFKDYRSWKVALLSCSILYFSVCTFTYFSQVKSYSDWLWYNIQANPGNLNFNVSTLFMLKRRNYSPELIEKFATFIVEHNPEKEVLFARTIALYTPEGSEAKKTVLDIAGYLSNVQTSNSFFHGAMLFLETEAFRFFDKDQTLLSLNSLYFSRLNTTVFLGDTTLKHYARKNFESVLQIQSPPQSVGEEKLSFLKLRSRIILLLFFNENTGLNLDETLSLLQGKYSDLPETQWLTEKIQKLKKN